MRSRLPFRIIQFLAIMLRLPGLIVKHERPVSPRSVLVMHQLLLGDALMTTSLLAKLRENHPGAEIYLAVPEGLVPLYSGRPYGVKAVPFDLFSPLSLLDLLRLPKFDWALIPGDNRYGWTAFAIGARWIVGFDGDRPGYKSWCFNQLILWPQTPQTWTDIAAGLVEGPPPKPFRNEDWPAPEYCPFPMPAKPYVIIHVGTRSPLKAWPVDKWEAVIAGLREKGLTIVLSCGPKETRLIEELKVNSDFCLYPGNLSLPQMWGLLKEAALLVCPDNGIAHLGRIAGTHTVSLFGPGSPVLFGTGHFWSKAPFKSVSKPVACRDQHNLFKRSLPWIETCERSSSACSYPECMHKIEVQDILKAASEVLSL